MNISVCIATHRRPQRLAALLEDLARQRCLPQEVVVVDNDAGAGARAVVQHAVAAGAPFPIRYGIQAQKNISLTRNRSIALAQGDWLAFIDDDERAPPGWLEDLARTADQFDADGVLGPVQPVLPSAAPAWLRRGRFYHWARMDTGTVVPPNLLRFGNVLLRRELLDAQQFNPAFGLTGGEDGDLLTRLVQRGAHVIWCDQAVVNEPIEMARLSLRWLLLRSLRGGQDYARHALAGRYGPATVARRVQLFLRALLQMLAAVVLALLSLPLGRHRSAQWLAKACANLGKLSAFLGWHYREYA
jgi:succinoglycan biosynthesis protein ExoM